MKDKPTKKIAKSLFNGYPKNDDNVYDGIIDFEQMRREEELRQAIKQSEIKYWFYFGNK